MNEKLLNIAKEVGFDISLGEITILHMNRHINVTSQVKRLIELVQASAMPDGWQLVPIEPAKEMCEAGVKEHRISDGQIYYTYKAMLKDAPKPPITNNTELLSAAKAIIAGWDNKEWKHFNGLINRLRQALEKIGE